MKRSGPAMTASTPRSTPLQNGSPTSAVTTPIIDVVPRVRSRRANWFGLEAELAGGAASTLATLSGRTLPSLLRARDTVFGETPARAATSFTVGARRAGDGVIARLPPEAADQRRIGVAGDRVGDRRCGVGDTLAHGHLRSGRPCSMATSVAPSSASPAPIGLTTSTVGAGTNSSRGGRQEGDAVTTRRHDRLRRRRAATRRGARRPAAAPRRRGGRGRRRRPPRRRRRALPTVDPRTASSASARLGLSRSAPAAAASSSRSPATSTATERAAVVDELDQLAWASAATPGGSCR